MKDDSRFKPCSPRFIALALVVVLAMTACASMSTPKKVYYAARTTFNDAVDSYITQKSTADPLTQLEWEAEIEPVLKDAQVALNIWGLAVSTPGASTEDKQAAYNEIRLDLFQLLLKHEILKIE